MSITVKNLSYIYMKGTPYEKKALDGVSLVISDGDFLGIIGSTGSGKSTFIRHLNGLLKAYEGTIDVDGIDLSAKKPDYKLLRQKVGMVFQYPEAQLFADTVLKDVAYGPKNMKKPPEECEALAHEAMELVGLDFEAFKNRSPFELSGGEKRRAAIAGVIAMKPKYLILDEPSAGLDPKGKDDIYRLILKIKASHGSTVVVISHDIDEITEYADRIAAFDDGKIFADFNITDVGQHADDLIAHGLDIPITVKLSRALGRKSDGAVRQSDFVRTIADAYKEGGL
ncbi:MAG: ATP-binding cassette domain-containing protein [Clostridiales bacterium]|jgi:energy-coupling factor transport system ATP-binding protein|nr:ATP-binding cassette domain-containing protein [Clostridiales bacterium]